MTPLLSLRIGRVQAFGDGTSAIAKLPVTGPIRVGMHGLAGDEHADTRHHGGPDKALHHYPAEHYPAWARELPAQAAVFAVGGFGENLSTLGLSEDDVCLGDVFQLGSATLQVAQGRSPCAKLNHRFGVADMVRRVQDSGRTGWYYRVLGEGVVAPDDALTLIERPQPAWTVSRLFRTLFLATTEASALADLARLEVLSANWRERARNRLTAQP